MISFNRSSESKSKIISRRMFMLSTAKLIVFSGIVGRLFYLQISENIKYTSLSEKNRLREWRLPPHRGLIKDYFGKNIADNSQVYQLHLIPENIINYNELFFRLTKIINLSDKDIKNLKKTMSNQKPWEPVIISENLSWDEFSRLNLFLHETPGIKPIVSIARKYPTDGSSSHIIGYVGSVSKKDLKKYKYLKDINVPGLKIGKNGLESYLNKKIIGSAGYQRYEVNAYGKKIKEIKSFSGDFGKNFKTTLDLEIQKFVSNKLEDKSGAVCVMDIYTGDIVSLVSNPTFDANKFVHGISKDDWNDLINNEKKPLLNKAIAGLYPPGSTIKPIVAISALENDVISTKMVVNCTGQIELYGSTYHCWKAKGHGFLNLRMAIAQSCDCFFYEVTKRLGVDRLAETAKKFGLGYKVLGILNEEKVGIVPSTKWKKKYIGKNWYLGESLLAGIGQGYFKTSPLQICHMMAHVANGGYKVNPRIIDDKNSFNNGKPFEQLVRNVENVKFVQDALFSATNEPGGTAYRSRYTSRKYIYAGKTGTSQIKKFTEEQRKLKIKYTDIPYEERDHALFAAYAPYNNPRYAISVVIEHGGSGSSVAAPIAKAIVKKVIDRHQKRMSHQEDFYL